jgi:succinylarginine dihydrolase
MRYPARQTLEASQAVARRHGLHPERTFFIQQNPAVIDAGVFHNDVIAVGNQNVLFYHQEAFLGSCRWLDEIRKQFTDTAFYPIQVPTSRVSVAAAVKSYLFNSQLLTKPMHAPATAAKIPNEMLLVLPQECRENPQVWAYLQELITLETPITDIEFFQLRESMHNGGGPACLRLRVVLTESEITQVHPGIFLNDDNYQQLCAWVKKYYRDRLQAQDLFDPELLHRTREALDELTTLLNLKNIYNFQFQASS